MNVTTTESKGRMAVPNRMNFRKSSKREGGSFLIQGFILQTLGTLNRAFEHEIDKNKSKRVQGIS